MYGFQVGSMRNTGMLSCLYRVQFNEITQIGCVRMGFQSCLPIILSFCSEVPTVQDPTPPLYIALTLAAQTPPRECSNLFNFDLTLQETPPPPTCPNLFTMKDVQSVGDRLASYWNAFLLQVYYQLIK